MKLSKRQSNNSVTNARQLVNNLRSVVRKEYQLRYDKYLLETVFIIKKEGEDGIDRVLSDRILLDIWKEREVCVQTKKQCRFLLNLFKSRGLMTPYIEDEFRLMKSKFKGTPVNFCPYEERDSLLGSLGFKSYQHYLSSSLWKSIREEVLQEHPDCFGCGEAANQIHHTRYSARVLKGEERRSLKTVCSSCHRKAEYEGKNKIKNLGHVNERLREIRKSRIGSN